MNTWLFQANPDRFDVTTYVEQSRDVYWSIKKLAWQRQVSKGDEVFIWRAMGSARVESGVIASGYITLPATNKSSIQPRQPIGESLWRPGYSELSPIKVGIHLSDVRTSSDKGMLLKEVFTSDLILARSQIVTVRSGAVFLLPVIQANRIRELWAGLKQGPLMKYSNTRIMRRCGQLQISYEDAIASPYFSSQSLKPPHLQIAFQDGVGDTVDWGKNKHPIKDHHTVPLDKMQLLTLLGENFKNEGIKVDLLKGTDNFFESPEEVSKNEHFNEGATKTISVNIYERSGKARKACLEEFGYVCPVCGFDFEKNYGTIGKGFIHVHHLLDLAAIGKAYQINPKEDLRPVCPNCHAMLHKKKPAYPIEELKKLIATQ